MDAGVKASSTWTRSAGCDLVETISTKVSHEDIFIKPELDELLNENHAVLLKCSSERVPCEVDLHIFPRYKIEALTLVCSAPKLEIFLGPQREYEETVYGAIISDDDGNVEPMCSYRYDIEIQKSGVVELSLKLLTSSDEMCIYSIFLQIAPNPNGITTLLPSIVNTGLVKQAILNSSMQKTAPKAEKCEMFGHLKSESILPNLVLQSGASGSSISMPNHETALNSQIFSNIANNANMKCDQPPTLDNIIKAHIDMRLHELETKLNERLNIIETQQRIKFDEILKILNKNKLP